MTNDFELRPEDYVDPPCPNKSCARFGEPMDRIFDDEGRYHMCPRCKATVFLGESDDPGIASAQRRAVGTEDWFEAWKEQLSVPRKSTARGASSRRRKKQRGKLLRGWEADFQ